jgi:N-acetylneuraminate synthase/N,N'-diacetyllegionaminate synthase
MMKDIPHVKIGDRLIGERFPPFIVVEAGINHNGELEKAFEMIRVAKEAGVDAIKFQTFSVEEFIADKNLKYSYISQGREITEPQIEMFKRVELSEEDTKKLCQFASQVGITFFSTPSNRAAVDLLCEINVPAIKVASGDLTNYPLLEHIARKRKTIVLATGMANLGEVGKAIDIFRESGNEEIILLHCVASYPAKAQEVNLRAMETLRLAFQFPVGFSDHTEGIEIALAAVARGACVIEKHFTLDKGLPGPDHRFSADPSELEALVTGIRKVQQALGSPEKRPSAEEKEMIGLIRRSIVANVDILAGAVISKDMLYLKRPGTGLSADILPYLEGRKAKRALKKGQMVRLEDVE